MPTYAIVRGASVNGRTLEPAGGGFNKQLLTDLLRGKYGFKGIVISDWAVTNDCNVACRTGNPQQQGADIGMSWGVEELSKADRFAKGIAAGIDQFGGTTESRYLVEAVRTAKVTTERIDVSVRRVLLQKFQQGLFEDPFVDPDAAQRVVGSAEFVAAGLDAQRRALVLLENSEKLLPLQPAVRKVYLRGVSPEVARSYGLSVVEQPSSADVAIVRVSAPFERLHPGYFFGNRQNEGSLAFVESNPDYQQIKAVSALVPTVVVVFLDRPAILANVRDKAKALIGDFGASDAALLDVLTGRAAPRGHLPMELPASMSQVEQQASDAPADIGKPLYPLGWGLSY
jgi:beta-glucosidase